MCRVCQCECAPCAMVVKEGTSLVTTEDRRILSDHVTGASGAWESRLCG